MSSNLLQRWEYRDTDHVEAGPGAAAPSVQPSAAPEITEQHVEMRVRAALLEAEQRWTEAASASDAQRRLQMQATLCAFAAERAKYFRELEGEVVHLALAVARKILMREASLDPELLAGLVRVALDRLSAGAAVKVHVPTAETSVWENTGAFADAPYLCEVIADASLAPGDCRVETDRGTASFGLEGQFKEIERGLLDVLARRPPVAALECEAPLPLVKAG